MSVNSSNSSFQPPMNLCFSPRMSIFTFSAFSVTHLFLVLLIVLIFYLSCQNRRKRRSAATGDSDTFTHHSTLMLLNEVLGVTLFFCGRFVALPAMASVGFEIWCVTSLGQAKFHVLTCVEHYLAVVQPVAYLRLRRITRARDVVVGCVWSLSLGWLPVYHLCSNEVNTILIFCCLFLFLAATSFCSVAVLRALRRPKPGEAGSGRGQQSKRRAFHVILAITGVLLVNIGGNMFASLAYPLDVRGGMCVLYFTMWLFNLPSRLVLPLLFLNRARTAAGAKPG